MTTPNAELIARLRAGAFPTGMGHWGDLHCEAADALEAQQAEIGHVMQGWRCECSTDDACRFARERDTLRDALNNEVMCGLMLEKSHEKLRAQLEQIAATEPESLATDQTDEFGEVIYREVFTRPMPADVTELVDALEKLARLGNSDGNMIARDALSKYKGAK